MAALFGKKDPNDAEAPEGVRDDQGSEFGQLTEQLGQLARLLAKANEQVAAYLVRRESQAAGAAPQETAAGTLDRRIAALAEKVDRLAEGTPPASAAAGEPSGEQALRTLLEPLSEKLDHVEEGLKQLAEASAAPRAADGPSNAAILEAVSRLQTRLDAAVERLADLVAPAEEPADEAPAPGLAEWGRAVLGAELAEQPALAFQRQELMGGVLEGDPGACALAGQLLVFQSAPAERLPQLLKDLGEAFYRWQPKNTPGTNPFEQALVAWLKRRCEAAGIYNDVELVHPGERFDATRHTAGSRGVEVTEVHGWIVLRDNGKVYTKATVSVH